MGQVAGKGVRTMGEMTATEIWALVLAGASAVVLLYNAGKAIGAVWARVKAPDREQEKRIATLEKEQDHIKEDVADLKYDVDALRKHHEEDMTESRCERALMMEAQLACLKGLQEQGCNGSVSKAIEKVEKYLNKKAHE